VARDRCDDRLADPRHRSEGRRESTGPVHHVGVCHGRHLFDVGSGRKDPFPPVQHHRPDVGPLVDDFGGGPQRIDHFGVQCVHRWAVQADRADRTIHLEPHELAHV
jgi:hypothetical protein